MEAAGNIANLDDDMSFQEATTYVDGYPCIFNHSSLIIPQKHLKLIFINFVDDS
jgi:hypothetical protein